MIHQKSQPALRGCLLVGLLFVCAAFLPGTAWADVYGSNPTVNLGTLDSCSGCLFAYVDFPGTAAGQTVLSYQFYNDAGARTTNELTPVLLEKTGGRTFEILGIGAPSTGFAAGYNSVSFVLVPGGSATVLDASTFFGYVDGVVNGTTGQITGNTGTIPSNYPAGSGTPGYFAGAAGLGGAQAPPLTVLVGDSVTTDAWADVGQGPRTYSLQVTTTPEPGFYGLLALGLGAVVVGLRRRGRRT